MLHRPRLQGFNFQKWIDDNAHRLQPPVSNQRVFETADMIVMVVGGPNNRTDFHDDPVEEFFYQIKGDMVLKIADDGQFYDVPLREGEVLLMPPHLRHSPQRPKAGSFGLVVEPKRYPGDDVDGFEWFCFECGALVHRAEFRIEHIVRDLPLIYERFYTDEAARKCPKCGVMHPGKEPPPGWVML